MSHVEENKDKDRQIVEAEVKLSADQHDLVIKALSQIPTGEARDLGDLFEKAKSHDVLNDFTA